MLNIRGKSIRNKKLTIKFFLEGFQFVLKCPSIRFDASLGKKSRFLSPRLQVSVYLFS